MNGYELKLTYRFRLDAEDASDPDAVAAAFGDQVAAWVGGFLGSPPFAAALVLDGFEVSAIGTPPWDCVTVTRSAVETYALMDVDQPVPRLDLG